MSKLSTFVRTTGARWLWPLLALVLLTVVWLAHMAAVGHSTSFVLAVLLLSGAGLFGTVVLVCRLMRLVGEAEDARRAEEVTHQRLRDAQAQAQAADKRLREATDAMPSGLAIYDEKHTLLACNQQASRMFNLKFLRFLPPVLLKS